MENLLGFSRFISKPNLYWTLYIFSSNKLISHFVSGTVTCLCFTPDGSHLVATSEDGSIKFFRVGSWQVEKDFSTAHKGTGQLNFILYIFNCKLKFIFVTRVYIFYMLNDYFYIICFS